MANLLASADFFVALHRVVSGSSLRDRIVHRTGDRLFGRLFQLASVAGLAWLVLAYAGADAPEWANPLWMPPPLLTPFQLPLQLFAVLLIVAGFSTPNPGTFRQEAVADKAEPVQGVLRLTRHPFLWGMALFAAGHMFVVPSIRSLVVFGALLLVALGGTFSIDNKRDRKLGSKWRAFASNTSNLSFAAIVAGRQRFAFGELGWKRPAAAVAAMIVLVLLHPWYTGASALP